MLLLLPRQRQSIRRRWYPAWHPCTARCWRSSAAAPPPPAASLRPSCLRGEGRQGGGGRHGRQGGEAGGPMGGVAGVAGAAGREAAAGRRGRKKERHQLHQQVAAAGKHLGNPLPTPPSCRPCCCSCCFPLAPTHLLWPPRGGPGGWPPPPPQPRRTCLGGRGGGGGGGQEAHNCQSDAPPHCTGLLGRQREGRGAATAGAGRTGAAPTPCPQLPLPLRHNKPPARYAAVEQTKPQQTERIFSRTQPLPDLLHHLHPTFPTAGRLGSTDKS